MNKNNIALVFPGQGSQMVGMGKDLYDNFSCAREVFDQIDEVLNFKLSSIIFNGPIEELTKTENTQPALMAVSIAIIEILSQEFGKKIEDICSFVAGHSLGEYSALCAARAFSVLEAAKLLQIRGREMAACGKKSVGAMAALLGTEIELVREITILAAKNGGICQIANDNSIGQIVISGNKEAVERAIVIAKEKAVKRAVMLPVSGAFHCELMREAENKMAIALEKAEIKSPIIPLIANVSANIVCDPKEIKSLLTRQITAPVRWRETMIFMQQNDIKEIIEIGSGKVLAGLVSRTCPEIISRSVQNLTDIKQLHIF